MVAAIAADASGGVGLIGCVGNALHEKVAKSTMDQHKMTDLQKPYSETWTDSGSRADNAVVRRITTFGLVALAGLVFTTSASAQPLKPAACRCGTLAASGRGWIGNWATGSIWGSVSSGTVWVRARTSSSKVGVSHYSSKAYDSSVNAWRYKGTNMRFLGSGTWWVKVQGTGIAESATAVGTAHLKGTGKYHLNGGPARAWPSSDTAELSLQD